MLYDTIIIGAGSAGCSAAIYATRYNLKTLLLGGPMPGGLITEALDVENYPGYLSINGIELANKFIDQAVKLGAELKIEIVSDISKDGDNFKVTASGGEYVGKTVILAMGTHHKKLGIPGEAEYAGKGVSYCATCDAPFYKGKTVVVAGGGNSAVEGAKDIAVHAKNVYLISRSSLKAAPFYIDQLLALPNVIHINDTNVRSIIGSLFVEAVELDKPYNDSYRLPTDGVFIQIGYQPQNEILKELNIKLTANGYVSVDTGMGTSIPGIFSAGDLNNASNMLHQQVTSAAEGAIAAQSVYRYISSGQYIIKEL